MRELATVTLPPVALEYVRKKPTGTPGLSGKLATAVDDRATIWTSVPLESASRLADVTDIFAFTQGGTPATFESYHGFLRDWLSVKLQERANAAAVLVDHLASPGDPALGRSKVRVTADAGAVYVILDLHTSHIHTISAALRFISPDGTIVLATGKKSVCEYEERMEWPLAILKDAEETWETIIVSAFDGEAYFFVERPRAGA